MFARCDALGEQAVREMFLRQEFVPWERPTVGKWLAIADTRRSARADEREEETLEIARKALSNSEKARFNSIAATIIAAIAMVLSTIIAIVQLIAPVR